MYVSKDFFVICVTHNSMDVCILVSTRFSYVHIDIKCKHSSVIANIRRC